MSALIEAYRKSTEGRSDEELVNAYHELLFKIDQAAERGKRRKVVQYCVLSLPFIESLIRVGTTRFRPSTALLLLPYERHELEAERPCCCEQDGSPTVRIPFRVQSIPAIEELAETLGQDGNRAQLANLRELVWYFPELEPWRKDVEDAERVIELRPRFEQFFREHTTCLRKDLPEVLPDLPREVVLRVVDDLVEVGVLQTGKEGRFVSVFLAQENPGGTDASPQP